MASLSLSSSLDFPFNNNNSSIFGSNLKLGEYKLTLLRLSPKVSKINPALRLKASRISPGLTKEAENNRGKMSEESMKGHDPFCEMRQRFLSFKRDKYLGNIEHFRNLAEAQSPKFTVIACADSRVCPSNILGFQPGEAFTVRNVANLVPPFESGPSETKAALEFSVNTLQVENILVVGHSCCGGIRALMEMQDEEKDSRSFIKSWVIFGKNAKLITKSVASKLDLDQQCQHCEKESINHSLKNLLAYPWIQERVVRGLLTLHGGYYDFTDGTFEKWTLEYNHKADDGQAYTFKWREFWK